MENIQDILFLILMVVLCFACFLSIYKEEKHKKEDKKIIIRTETYISQEQIFSELNNIINIYIEQFIYDNKLNDGEIYYTDDRLNQDAIKLSSEILLDLSEEFKQNIYRFITENALNIYVIKQIMKNLLIYGNNINKQI